MIKLHLTLLVSAMLAVTLCAHAQDRTVDDETLNALDKAVSEEFKEEPRIQTEDSLWQDTNANLNIQSLSAYLAKFPNGKYSDDAQSKLQILEKKAQARAKEDKELDAYRKQRTAGGLVLELSRKFTDVKPYIRSMLNSCGYVLVQPHRFAKRVYPTLEVEGRMFSGQSDGEHSVTLDLSLVLTTNTREIKAREKMRSYRTSNVDAHLALIAGFEDVGAQMKLNGFCAI